MLPLLMSSYVSLYTRMNFPLAMYVPSSQLCMYWITSMMTWPVVLAARNYSVGICCTYMQHGSLPGPAVAAAAPDQYYCLAAPASRHTANMHPQLLYLWRLTVLLYTSYGTHWPWLCFIHFVCGVTIHHCAPVDAWHWFYEFSLYLQGFCIFDIFSAWYTFSLTSSMYTLFFSLCLLLSFFDINVIF